MIHPHNPVMRRLEEMSKLWQERVKPHHRLVRWMLKPEDSRMYEGFCRLEASPHGFLNNLFIFFYTPFESDKMYSHSIMKNWLEEYDTNTIQRKALTDTGIKEEWLPDEFRNPVVSGNYQACDELLPKMIHSYMQWLNLSNTECVIALLPIEMNSPAGFLTWLKKWMNQYFNNTIQLLLFDHQQSNYWGDLFEQYKEHSCTLHHDLRMQEAIREIATAGSETDPYAFFRKCMFEMGTASQNKKRNGLDTWGQKAIEAAKKSGDKNLLATAYITYSGMLFNFKDHEKINSLLDEGLRLCRKEIANSNESMKSLLLQYFAYKGADAQIRKERKEALHWFMKMGEQAAEYGYWSQAVSAYYKALIFADHKSMDEEKKKSILAALQLTNKLTDEELKSTEYPFLAYELTEHQDLKHHEDLKEMVTEKMKNIYGENWKLFVDELKKNYSKKRLHQVEHVAMMDGQVG